MELYNYDTLTRLIGQTVQLTDQQGSQIELTIAEVTKAALDGEEWEAFSVVYHCTQDCSIPQGTFTFNHHAFGEVSLFISPNSATEYETCITRKRLF